MLASSPHQSTCLEAARWIARDAAALRVTALKRIAELEEEDVTAP
jgi:hypothetical protein